MLLDNPSDQPRGNVGMDALEGILVRCGSEWKVGSRDGHFGLEERVPLGVQEAADAIIATPGHAGGPLSEAWHAAFGVNPDYEKAYAKSVKAVEAAAVPVVSPTNATATLGTVISQLRSQGDWKLVMTREHADHATQQVAVQRADTMLPLVSRDCLRSSWSRYAR